MIDIEIPVGKRTKIYRFFEMLPGILSYLVILLPIILSLINPLWAAVFVLVYIITYLVKALAMAYRTIQGYNTLQRAQRIDWAARLADLEDPTAALAGEHSGNGWRHELHRQHLEQLSSSFHPKKPSDMYNAIIIAAYNESREVIEPTIQSVLASDYDSTHMILVLAYEERGGDEIRRTVTDLIAEYGGRFGDAIAVMHPKDLPNEVVGKGGNITYAGRQVHKHLEAKGIDIENVIVTTLDADNRPHKTYFSYVTYEYIIHPEPRHVAFQPLALYLNNIWDVPAPMRVVATGNSFWNIIVSLRPHLLRNFASHSQSMAALVDMDFWSTRTVVEDGHQFWRSYFRYDGHYDVVPIYVPIYQDAVLSDTYRKTLKAQFVQVCRWAYGASDVPYVATRLFRKDRTVPFFDGLFKFLRLLDSHVSWATMAVIILLGAWAPLFVNPEASRSIIAHQLPTIVSNLQTIAMIGLMTNIFLSFKLLPPRPERYKRRRTFGMLLQWVMMPVTSIIYGSAAAFYAQTRLLFGKYMDKFRVTDKAVVKDS